jgi:dihydrofolate reductase
MQTSLDLFVCDQNGSTEGFIWNWESDWKWDKELQQEFIELTQSVDCVLLSRKMAEEGFVDYWHTIATQIGNPASIFAKETDSAMKLVFSRTKTESKWPNTILASFSLTETISRLKSVNGKNIIAYCGVEFASELVKTNLVDEFIFYMNPIVFGKGRSIFEKEEAKIEFGNTSAKSFPCGIAIIKYRKRT